MPVHVMSQPAWVRMQALAEIRESLRLRPEGREFTDHNLAEHIVGYTTRGHLMPLNHGPYNVESPDGIRVLVKMARTKGAPEASTVSVRGTSLADLHEQFDALAVVVFPDFGYQLRSVRYYRPEEVWTDAAAGRQSTQVPGAVRRGCLLRARRHRARGAGLPPAAARRADGRRRDPGACSVCTWPTSERLES